MFKSLLTHSISFLVSILLVFTVGCATTAKTEKDTSVGKRPVIEIDRIDKSGMVIYFRHFGKSGGMLDGISGSWMPVSNFSTSVTGVNAASKMFPCIFELRVDVGNRVITNPKVVADNVSSLEVATNQEGIVTLRILREGRSSVSIEAEGFSRKLNLGAGSDGRGAWCGIALAN